jgi:hypothetical protein
MQNLNRGYQGKFIWYSSIQSVLAQEYCNNPSVLVTDSANFLRSIYIHHNCSANQSYETTHCHWYYSRELLTQIPRQ